MLKNLKALREEAGISQKQLADAVGVSQQSINKYENHKVEPDIDTMTAIADLFKTSVDYLIGHTDVRRRIEQTRDFALNAEEIAVLEAYRSLTKKQQESIRTVLKSYE